MIWTWLSLWWGCSASPSPEDPKPLFLRLDVMDLEKELLIPEIGARVKVLRMTTATLVGGGHRAHATVRVVWSDGTSEMHEEDLGMVFYSHGYEFVVDGMHGMASIDVRRPVTAPVMAIPAKP